MGTRARGATAPEPLLRRPRFAAGGRSNGAAARLHALPALETAAGHARSTVPGAAGDESERHADRPLRRRVPRLGHEDARPAPYRGLCPGRIGADGLLTS